MAYIAEPYASPQPAVIPKALPPEKQRYASIDALKGLSILFIWLITASLDVKGFPPQLKPGGWAHPTLADCVFPALLVAVGAGIPLSAEFRKDRDSMGRFLLGAVSKAFWLVLFGILMESAVARRPVFDCGALQLLGVAYLINAIFARTPVVLRVFLAEGLLLAFYIWAKMNVVPGAKVGTFTEAQNIISFTDANLFAPNGLQGFLALIPITSIVMSGSVIGSLYLIDDSPVRRSLIFLGIGGTLIFFSWLWSLDQPMVSAVWTSSFALFATGVAVVALGAFGLVFDFEKARAAAYPLTVPSTCVLLAIVAPVFFKTAVLDVWRWPGSDDTISAALKHLVGGSFAPPILDWVYPAGVVLAWWMVLAIVYHRRKWLARPNTS